jgi:hypothetical protein
MSSRHAQGILSREDVHWKADNKTGDDVGHAECRELKCTWVAKSDVGSSGAELKMDSALEA